ncbi:hypothetical protein AaE_003154, partial [Aphanomyces astaci]
SRVLLLQYVYCRAALYEIRMSGINEPSRHVRFFQLSTPRNNNDDDDVECTQESVERRRRWKLQAIPLVIFFMLFLSVLVPFVTTNKTIEGTY